MVTIRWFKNYVKSSISNIPKLIFDRKLLKSDFKSLKKYAGLLNFMAYVFRKRFFSVFPFSQNSYIKNSIESKEVPKGKSFLAFLRPNFGINLRFRIFLQKRESFQQISKVSKYFKKLAKSWSIIFHSFSILFLYTKINFT